MALVLADRVRETSTTTGTGTLTLAGAVTGFQSFSVVGNTNTTYYTITDSAGNWEVGVGTYTSSGTTFSRDTVLSSSNAGALVNFPAGTKDVFVTYPADYSVNATNNPGTTGQILASNGTGVAPTWGDKISSGTAVTASGTSIDFTAIPATTKRITVMFQGLSLSGSSDIVIRIGDGAIVATGYLGASTNITGGVNTTNISTGFFFFSNNTGANANLRNGMLVLTLINAAANIWAATGQMGFSDTGRSIIVAGSKTLASTLDRVRVTSVNGTDTFDAGTVNVLWE